MDNPRGNFAEGAGFGGLTSDYDPAEDVIAPESPPSPVGQDERRMQVRAYNYWTSLLGNRNFPSIEDLDPEHLDDFGPYGVLLDFTAGIDNPGVSYLGDKLADECGTHVEIATLSDVPSRSLLSRITDHYMQILANQAPIGFEAEFLNLHGRTVLYRGILLPFSSDDDTIDFIYGVINWKELADRQTTDRLLREIDEALEEQSARIDAQGGSGTMEHLVDAVAQSAQDEDGVLDLGALIRSGFAAAGMAANDSEPADRHDLDEGFAGPDMDHATLPDWDEDVAGQPEMTDPPADMALADWLASARELARIAGSSEDRTRQALYAAIGRAYDFYLASCEQSEDFAELLADSGLAMQARAPATPVVKLVFGADYDKTRLTEYAAALNHARRLDLARGALAPFLADHPGGLKAVVALERRLKREEAGSAAPADARPARLARKLRHIEPQPMEAILPQGEEFALVLIRRLADGRVALLGEVAQDIALIEKAASKLVS